MQQDLFTALFSQGVAVAVAAWFMLRLEGLLKENSRQLERNTRATLLATANDPHRGEGERAAANAMLKNGEARDASA